MNFNQFEALSHLRSISYAAHNKSPCLSRSYTRLLLSSNIPLHSTELRRQCTKCATTFIPGMTCSVRVCRKRPVGFYVDQTTTGRNTGRSFVYYVCRACGVITLFDGARKSDVEAYDRDALLGKISGAIAPPKISTNTTKSQDAKRKTKKRDKSELKSLVAKSRQQQQDSASKTFSLGDFLGAL